MAKVKGEPPAVSPVLFLNVKGEPMRFFIRPGPAKVQLQPLIISGGGVVSRTQEPSAILLAEPGDLRAGTETADQFYISTQYIRDCMEQNHQLDLESYRLSNLQPVRTRASAQKRGGNGRMGYSLEDDAAILDFIRKRSHEAKGNRVWQRMEQLSVTAHSWQSMKDRFLKHLQYKLNEKTPEKEKESLSDETSPTLARSGRSKKKNSSSDELSPASAKSGTPMKKRSLSDEISPASAKSGTPKKKSSLSEEVSPSLAKSGTPKKKSSLSEEVSPSLAKSETPKKMSSSSDEVSPALARSGTRMTTRRKMLITSSSQSSDSDAPQNAAEDPSRTESGQEDQPNPQKSPKKSSSDQLSETEKKQTLVISDKGQTEACVDNSVQEEQPQCNQESEQPGPSPKRARRHKDVPEMDASDGPNNQMMSHSEAGPKGGKMSTPGKRKLGILERAAREFEDSQLDNESQEDQPPSRESSTNASDTDETQIMVAREKALKEQEANMDSNDAEPHLPWSRNNRTGQKAPDNVPVPDEAPGPSNAVLPITSNAHMFLFDSESQEDPSQPSQDKTSSQNLQEVKQHVLNLIEDTKRDLAEVVKALLKASGDVMLARSYLLNGYHPEEHGPMWSREDDQILLSEDSSGSEQLFLKFGAEKVARRVEFLKSE